MKVAPLTVDAIIRSHRRDRPLLVGWLIENLLDAAQAIAPDFMPDRDTRDESPRRLTPTGWAVDVPPPPSRLARWLRRLPAGDEATDTERGQGLAEYALILVMVAIIAAIGLLLLGQQVSDVLSRVGHSVTPP